MKQKGIIGLLFICAVFVFSCTKPNVNPAPGSEDNTKIGRLTKNNWRLTEGHKWQIVTEYGFKIDGTGTRSYKAIDKDGIVQQSYVDEINWSFANNQQRIKISYLSVANGSTYNLEYEDFTVSNTEMKWKNANGVYKIYVAV